MGKRIFKTIGIVVGSIMLLFGGIVGVFAIMGKFKREVVFPDRIFFADVSQNVTYDTTNPNVIHSFTLSATSTTGNEVTEKTAYVYFEGGYDDKLITLCNNVGQPIQKNTEGKYQGLYKVDCNSPIYFKVNGDNQKFVNPDGSYGCVKLSAVCFKDDSRSAATSTPKTIWVDRTIKHIYVGNDAGAYNIDKVSKKPLEPGDEQHIAVTLNSTLSLGYVVDPSTAFKPMSAKDIKNVVLYVDGIHVHESYIANVDQRDDFIPVVNNMLDANGHKFIEYDATTGRYTFIAPDKTGSYRFRVAVNATYDNIAQKLPGDTNDDYLLKMINTDVIIDVQDTDVTRVDIGLGELELNLYTDNNLLILSDRQEGGINLDLSMTNDSGNVTVEEERFNGIQFGFDKTSSKWKTSGVFFESENRDQSLAVSKASAITDGYIVIDGIEYSVNYGKVVLKDDTTVKKLIVSIEHAGNVYKCKEGVAFMCKTGSVNNINVLTSGSYFDFFNYVGTIYTTADDFDYTPTAITTNQGKSNSWKVIAKSIPANTDNLVFAIMVVNSDGSYFMDKVNVKLNEIPVQTEPTTSTLIPLNITYNTSGVAQYESKAFDTIVDVKTGTYTACVFVTPYVTGSNYAFDILDKYITINGANYAIVGYKDASNNFVNAVRASTQNTNSIFMQDHVLKIAQFVNNYGQTAEEYVTQNIINGNRTTARLLTDEYNVKVIFQLTDAAEFSFANETSEFITVHGNSRVDAVVTSAATGDSGQRLVNLKVNSSSHAQNMISNIYWAIAQNNTDKLENYLKVYAYENGNEEHKTTRQDCIEITAVELTGANDLAIYYTITGQFNGYFKFEFEYDNVTIKSLPIYLLSDAPTSMEFKYNGGATVLPIATETENTYIKIVIGYDTSRNIYTYSYYIVNNGAEAFPISASLFNKTSNANTLEGFVAQPAYSSITRNVSYSSTDSSILEFDRDGKLIVNKVGLVVLSVQSVGSTVTGRINVRVVSDSFNINIQAGSVDNNSVASLQDYVKYTYSNGGGSPINLSLKDVKFTNKKELAETDILITKSGIDGLKVSLQGATDTAPFKIVDRNNNTVLTVVKDGNDWKFTKTDYKTSDLSIQFRVYVPTIELGQIVNIQWVPEIGLNQNADWHNFYANTRIKLYSTDSDSNAAFIITDRRPGGNTLSVSAKVSFNNGAPAVAGDEFTFNDGPGEYTFYFYENKAGSSDISIDSRTILVTENIVGFVSDKTQNVVTDKDDYIVADFVTFKAYKSGITFGSTDLSGNPIMYTNYTDDSIFTSYVSSSSIVQSLVLDGEYNYISLVNDNILLKVEWDDDVKLNVTEKLKLKTSLGNSVLLVCGNEICDAIDFNITNKYANRIKVEGGADYTNLHAIFSTYVNYSKTFMWVNLDDAGTYKAYISDITTDSEQVTITTTSDGFYFTFNQREEDTIINVNVEFVIDGHTLKCALTGQKVIPYVPDTLQDVMAHPQESFDLINNVFNMATIVADANSVFNTSVTSLVVTGVDNSSLINGSLSGYLNYNAGTGWTLSSCSVQIQDIQTETQKLTIYYLITYKSGLTYAFSRTIDVTLKDSVEIVYPVELSSDYANDMKFFAQYTKDALELSGDTTPNSYNVYSVNFDKYEAVTIAYNIDSATGNVTEIGSTINLNSADSKRVYVKDKHTQNEVNTSYSVDLIAYSNLNASTIENNFINRGNITCTGSTISFKTTGGLTGLPDTMYFIFKISAQSGTSTAKAVGYYKVIVYNVSNTDICNVSNMHNANISVTANDANTLFVDSTNGTILSKSIQDDIDFENTFNVPYDEKISIYLLQAKSQEGATEELSLNKGSLIVPGSTKLPVLHNHYLIKLQLVYKDETIIAPIGTITCYVNPIVTEHASTLTAVENAIGEYNYTITTTEDITLPFTYKNNDAEVTGTTTLEIVDVIGSVFDNTTTSITYLGTNIISINGTSVRVSKYIDTTLIFKVKYTFTYTLNSTEYNLITYVNYTLNRTCYTDNEEVVTLGDSYNTETSTFNNILYLSINNRIPNGYKGEVQITVKDSDGKQITSQALKSYKENASSATTSLCPNIAYGYTDNYLYISFIQTTNINIYDIVITLNDLVKPAGSNVNTLTLKVTVNPSLSIKKGIEGSTSSTATASEYNLDQSKINYNSETGSRLKITVTPKNNGVVLFSLDRVFSIYAESGSVLHIAAQELDGSDASRYLTGGTNPEIVSVVGNTSESSSYIDFRHLAQDKTIKLYITISKGANYYQTTHTVYVNIVKTYYGLAPIYKMVGATHENVKGGTSSYNMYEQLFVQETSGGSVVTIKDITNNASTDDAINNKFRVGLITLDEGHPITTNYDPKEMGFTSLGGQTTSTLNGNPITIYDNPNLLKVSPQTNTLINAIEAESNKNISLAFGGVTSTRSGVILKLTNNAGVTFEYRYQIMVDDNALVDAPEEDNYAGNKINTYTTEEIREVDGEQQTVTVTHKYSSINLSADITKEYAVAKLADENFSKPSNTPLFYLTAFGISYVDGTYGSSITGKAKVGSTYTLYYGSNATLATLRLGANGILYIKMGEDAASVLDGPIVFTITMYSDDLVEQNFEIVCLNSSARVTESAKRIWYGGQTITLNSVFEVVGSASSAVNFKLVDGSYMLGNQTHTVSELGNIFVNYTGINKDYTEIELTQIAADEIGSTLYFDVFVNFETSDHVTHSAYLSTLSYGFTIKRSFKYQMNNADITNEPIEYTLTSGNIVPTNLDGDTYWYTINLAQVRPDSDTTTTILNLSVVPVNAGLTSIGLSNLLSGITVRNADIWGGVKYEGWALYLKHDASGDMRITLELNLYGAGLYQVDVTIKVKGFTNISYFAMQDSVMQKQNGEGFSSTAQITPIAKNSVQDSTAIFLTTTITATPPANDPVWGGAGNLQITANYAYVVVNADMMPQNPNIPTVFGNQPNKVEGSAPVDLNNNNIISFNLPFVGGEDPVYVIYMFTFTYLNQTTAPYYATYTVVSNSILLNPQSSKVLSLDGADSHFVVTSDEEVFLPLFYYAEEYTGTDSIKYLYKVEYNEYSIEDSDETGYRHEMVLYVNTTKYVYDESSKQFKNGNTSYSLPTPNGAKYKIVKKETNDTVTTETALEVSLPTYQQQYAGTGNAKSLYVVNTIGIDIYYGFIKNLTTAVFTDMDSNATEALVNNPTFPITYLTHSGVDYGYGINLARKDDEDNVQVLLIDTLVANINVYTGGSKLVTTQLTIQTPESSLTPVASATMSEIFGDYYGSASAISIPPIIGIANTTTTSTFTSWVTGESVESVEIEQEGGNNKEYARVNVEGKDYIVYKLIYTYSTDASSVPIYNNTVAYAYIYDNSETPSFIRLESRRYYFPANSEAEKVVNISLKQICMEGNGIAVKNLPGTTNYNITSATIGGEAAPSGFYSLDGNSIKVTLTTLQAYKDSHTSATQVTVMYTIDAKQSGTTIANVKITAIYYLPPVASST